MKIFFVLVVCAVVITNTAFAQVTRITFDGPPVQARETQSGIPQYSESGFLFKPFGPIDSSPPYRLARNGGGISFYPENGTPYLQASSALGGSPFTLLSVDLAEYSMFFTSPTVTLNAFRADGTTISATLTLDGLIDGTGPSPDFQTFSLGPGFSNLLSVKVPTQGYSLDNVVVAVPEPSLGSLLVSCCIFFFPAARRIAFRRTF
jgi:hypothetical protein